MCFDRNINGNRDVKFLIGIIGHCTDQRKILYLLFYFSIMYRCKREIIISRQIPDSQSLVLTSNLYANDAVMYEIDYCIHTALIC